MVNFKQLKIRFTRKCCVCKRVYVLSCLHVFLLVEQNKWLNPRERINQLNWQSNTRKATHQKTVGGISNGSKYIS